VPYTRAHLKLLLTLAAIALTGLAVREWRAGFPDLAERLERFDREESPASLAPAPRLERRPARPARALAAPAPAPAAEGDAAAPEGTPTADPRPLDINRASQSELARLPGVGAALAGRILAERERRGRFDSPEALRDVFGMGPKKLAAIRDLVTVTE